MIQPENENIVRAALYIQDNGINTVRKLCDVEGIVYNKRVPSFNLLQRYNSKSNNDLLNILDMNLGHVLRAFSSTIAKNQELEEELSEIKSSRGFDYAKKEYQRGWNTAYKQIKDALFSNEGIQLPLDDDEPKLMEDIIDDKTVEFLNSKI